MILCRALYIDLCVSSGSFCAKTNCRFLEIVIRNGIHDISWQNFLFVCYWCWCCRRGDLDLFILYTDCLSPASSAPNMSSAARMSCFTIGQSARDYFPILSGTVLDLDVLLPFVSSGQGLPSTLPFGVSFFISSTLFRDVSVSICLFVNDFYGQVLRRSAYISLTERRLSWYHSWNVLQACSHSGCQK